MQLKEGEILGHECMGIVEAVGPQVTKVKPGDRVVAAFNIACGQCQYCKKQQYTACECTNNSSVMEKLYGHRIAGVLGYSHVSVYYLTNEAKSIGIFIDMALCLYIYSSWVVSLAAKQNMLAFSSAIQTLSRSRRTYLTRRPCISPTLCLQPIMLSGKQMSKKERSLASGVWDP